MTINRIHHIAIIAGNYAVSKHFYTEVLGFTILAETFRAERNSYKLDLLVNNTYQIELFSFPDSRLRASYPEARGLRHLAFAVSNVDEWVQHLQKHGVAVQAVRIDDITGKKFTFFNDPDEQPLELYEE
jgi:glyoxylase I family protein